MNLASKRILVFFSIALNIGFVAMALFHTYDRAGSREERRWNELMEIVRGLNLPATRSEKVIGLMAGFRGNMGGIEKKIRAERMDTMDCLALPGPVDKKKLHKLLLDSDLYESEKRTLFASHVLELRQVLGNEDGALFFSRLRDEIRKKHKTSPR